MFAEIVTAVDSTGITGRWQIFRDADGRQIGRVKIEPGADARKDSGRLAADSDLSRSPSVTAPAPSFGSAQDDAQREMPVPAARQARRVVDDLFGNQGLSDG